MEREKLSSVDRVYLVYRRPRCVRTYVYYVTHDTLMSITLDHTWSDLYLMIVDYRVSLPSLDSVKDSLELSYYTPLSWSIYCTPRSHFVFTSLGTTLQ